MQISSFEELVSSEKWMPYDDYLRKFKQILKVDVERAIRYRERFLDRLSKLPELNDNIRNFSVEKLRELEGGLYNDCVATDGTLNKVPTTSGVKYRVGVVQTSYEKKGSISYATYVSDSMLVAETEDVTEFYKNLESVGRMSSILLFAIMLYKERELCLNSKKKWKMINGRLLPVHMRAGGLPPKTLTMSLELSKKLLEKKNFVAVVGNPKITYINLGYVLQRGQYFFVGNAKDVYMQRQLEASARYVKEEHSIVEEFVRKWGEEIGVGIYRVGIRPYVFESHIDQFDDAAHLIAADAAIQGFRGYPMLLDFADTMAHNQFPPAEFTQMVESSLADHGLVDFGVEIGEFMTRRR